MKLSDHYKLKKQKDSYCFGLSDLEGLEGNNLNVDDLKCLYLLLDKNVSDQCLVRVGEFIQKSDRSTRAEALVRLIPQIEELDLDALSSVFDSDDFQVSTRFFIELFDHQAISFLDKLVIAREILDSNIQSELLNDYIRRIVFSAKSVLKDKSSLKGVVRTAVSTLRHISKKFSNPFNCDDILREFYENNEVWQQYYAEEVNHRHNVLINSLGSKVDHAFRQKNYKRVVSLLKKHESELPKVLKTKLLISEKKLKE